MKTNTPKSIIIHHVGYSHSFYRVNSYHKKKWSFKSSLGWYIGYQYFVETNGKLFQGRKETEEGAHKKGWNDRAIGICLRGNLEEKKPTKQQLTTLRKLLEDIQKRRNIPNSEIYAHEELSNTLCPGKYLMPWLNEYRSYKQTEVKQTKKGRLSAIQILINKIKQKIINLKKKIKLWRD